MNLEIIPKVIQAYVAGFQLIFIYNSINIKSFQEASHTINGCITTKSAQIFYSEWLRLSDKNLDNELISFNVIISSVRLFACRHEKSINASDY